MSTNIHFSAVREVQVVKTGEITNQEYYINCQQTPTTVTRELIKAADPVKAYVSWVVENSVDVDEPVYAEDDIFCENDPIGYQKYNAGRDSAARFLWEIRKAKKQGYDIIVEAW